MVKEISYRVQESHVPRHIVTEIIRQDEENGLSGGSVRTVAEFHDQEEAIEYAEWRRDRAVRGAQ